MAKHIKDFIKSCEDLESLQENIFETSLNTFLAVSKTKLNSHETDALKIISQHIESISKKLKSNLNEFKEKKETFISIQNNYPQHIIIDLSKKLTEIEKLNQKLWLTMNQLRVQLTQSENLKHLETISINVQELNQKLEFCLKKLNEQINLIIIKNQIVA